LAGPVVLAVSTAGNATTCVRLDVGAVFVTTVMGGVFWGINSGSATGLTGASGPCRGIIVALGSAGVVSARFVDGGLPVASGVEVPGVLYEYIRTYQRKHS
jgi:hypothetical protein